MPIIKTKSNKAYIFFNCDAEKSQASKNIAYNHAVYGNAQTSRKALLKKIQDEVSKSRVVISAEDMKSVQKAILDGNPIDANKYMQFGDIMEIDKF